MVGVSINCESQPPQAAVELNLEKWMQDAILMSRASLTIAMGPQLYKSIESILEIQQSMVHGNIIIALQRGICPTI